LTYYPDTETVAGIEMEVMNVVRIKIAWIKETKRARIFRLIW
jgi:hypothetical protein